MNRDALLDQAIALLNQVKNEKYVSVCQTDKAANPSRTESLPGQPTRTALARIYWAGCRGLADLSRELGTGQRVDKLGISTEEKLNDRLAILGQDRYGAIERAPDGRMVERSGFDRWIAQALHITRPPRHPAIAVTARTIDVTLTAGMTRRQLDYGLRKGLAPYAADQRGIERFTAYSGVDRISRATELVFGLDPRRDGNLLLEIVEAILNQHDAVTASRYQPVLSASSSRPVGISSRLRTHQRSARPDQITRRKSA